MKTKLLFVGIGVVLLAAAVSILVYVNNGKNSMAEIFNANVEALANAETGLGSRMCVYQSSSPGDQSYILCSTCKPGRTIVYSMAFCDPD